MFFRKNIKYFLTVLVLLAVIFVSLRGGDNPAKGFLLQVSSPFLKTFRIFSGGIAGFFDFLGSIGDLKKENERLLDENQSILAENVRLKDFGKENQVLRKELDLAPRKDYDLESAYIIAQDPQGLGNYFFIDKGRDKGIEVGMPAIVSKGILVGRVVEVFPNTAKITLIADPSSVINAEVEDTEARGIIKGKYGLGVMMDMVSQTEELKEGDTVISSGLGGEIPRGFLIGRISRIEQSPDTLSKQRSLLPGVGFSTLSILLIVKT